MFKWKREIEKVENGITTKIQENYILEFDYIPQEPMSEYSPGCLEDVEITKITRYSTIPLTKELFFEEKEIEEFSNEEIEDMENTILNQIKEIRDDWAIAQAIVEKI